MNVGRLGGDTGGHHADIGEGWMAHATRKQARRLLLFFASAFVTSLLVAAPLAAQTCLHDRDADSPSANVSGRMAMPASSKAPAATHAPASSHEPMVAHVPMARSDERADLRAMTIGSHGCCEGGDGQRPSCPTCPLGGTCSAHGPVTAIHGVARIGVHIPTAGEGTPATDSRLPSWSGSVDTPPPRS